jgi:putative transposase
MREMPMARQPRSFVQGAVLHVIQRGNNREPVFAHEGDYRFFLRCLAKACREHGLLVHAYVLMTNHIHLLAMPLHEASLPKALQSVGRRYVQYFNFTYQRTGTLWEGRYRASVVDSERYLLTCMRYIELNPVRAKLVADPAEYVWSSHCANARGAPDALVSRHELYERLGRSEAERQRNYRELFRAALGQADVDAIREATNKNWALGNDQFRKRVEELSGRRSAPKQRGRPAKSGQTENRV